MTRAKPTATPRKSSRVTIDDASALALEKRLGSRESAASYSGRKGTVFERNGPRGERTVRKISVYLPLDLVRDLDVRCAVANRDRSNAIEEAVAAWLKRQESRRLDVR